MWLPITAWVKVYLYYWNWLQMAIHRPTCFRYCPAICLVRVEYGSAMAVIKCRIPVIIKTHGMTSVNHSIRSWWDLVANYFICSPSVIVVIKCTPQQLPDIVLWPKYIYCPFRSMAANRRNLLETSIMFTSHQLVSYTHFGNISVYQTQTREIAVHI